MFRRRRPPPPTSESADAAALRVVFQHAGDSRLLAASACVSRAWKSVSAESADGDSLDLEGLPEVAVASLLKKHATTVEVLVVDTAACLPRHPPRLPRLVKVVEAGAAAEDNEARSERESRNKQAALLMVAPLCASWQLGRGYESSDGDESRDEAELAAVASWVLTSSALNKGHPLRCAPAPLTGFPSAGSFPARFPPFLLPPFF